MISPSADLLRLTKLTTLARHRRIENPTGASRVWLTAGIIVNCQFRANTQAHRLPGINSPEEKPTPELPRRNTIQAMPANDSAAVVTGKSEVFTMERPVHNMSNLFAQLGQANDEAAIARFIETHSPLADNLQLHEAHFWNVSQAGFLRQALVDDADWAEITDQLNAELRAPGH